MTKLYLDPTRHPVNLVLVLSYKNTFFCVSVFFFDFCLQTRTFICLFSEVGTYKTKVNPSFVIFCIQKMYVYVHTHIWTNISLQIRIMCVCGYVKVHSFQVLTLIVLHFYSQVFKNSSPLYNTIDDRGTYARDTCD